MKIYLATDHAGFLLKEKLKTHLTKVGYDIEDCGAFSFIPSDDYPDFISLAAQNVSNDPVNSRGIIIGGSGEAEAMVANKYKGVRCGLFYTKAIPVGAADVNGRESHDPFEIIRLSREHNNANMLSLSARFLTIDDAIKAADLWLTTDFTNDPRHVRRIKKFIQLGE